MIECLPLERFSRRTLPLTIKAYALSYIWPTPQLALSELWRMLSDPTFSHGRARECEEEHHETLGSRLAHLPSSLHAKISQFLEFQEMTGHKRI